MLFNQLENERVGPDQNRDYNGGHDRRNKHTPDAGIPAKYFVTIITEMIPRVNRKRKTLKKVLENHNNFVIIGKVLDAHYIE